MKIVIDTNVIVSGLLNPFGAPGEILRLVASGDLTLAYDARIVSEYRSVLLRAKFDFDLIYVDILLHQIETCGELVNAQPLPYRLPDSDDEPFLEVALAGKVLCLVTGNVKHFPSKKQQKMLVVSPAEFITIYSKQKH